MLDKKYLVYSFKKLIGNKMGLMFGLGLPLALGLIFLMAFQGLLSEDTGISPIPVGIVVESENDLAINRILENIGIEADFKDGKLEAQESEDDKPIEFLLGDESYLKDLANQGHLDGIVYVRDGDGGIGFDIWLASRMADTIEADVLYSVLDHVAVVTRSVYEGLRMGSLEPRTLENFEPSKIIFNEIVQKERVNSATIYFLTSLAYICMYFMSSGAMVMTEFNPKEKYTAHREIMATKPINKLIYSFSLVSLLTSFAIITGLLLIYYYSGVPLGEDWLSLFLILALGTVVGFVLGIFVGTFTSLDNGVIQFITIGLPLFFAMGAGLMTPVFSQHINKFLPFLKYINPVELISSGLYYLAYYPGKEEFYQVILKLLASSGLLTLLSWLRLRGDSFARI